MMPQHSRFTRSVRCVTDQHARIVIDKRYAPGLLGLEGFSHIQVFWWFSRNDTPQRRSILQVHPRGNPQNPLTGVFATRAPFRPNLIALTLCKITSIHDNVIEIEKIDAFDGTPVLDIKPFIPGYDSVDQAATPQWLKHAGPVARQLTYDRLPACRSLCLSCFDRLEACRTRSPSSDRLGDGGSEVR